MTWTLAHVAAVTIGGLITAWMLFDDDKKGR